MVLISLTLHIHYPSLSKAAFEHDAIVAIDFILHFDWLLFDFEFLIIRQVDRSCRGSHLTLPLLQPLVHCQMSSLRSLSLV